MRTILFLIVLGFGINTFAQSKSEQIAILTSRIDSLNNVKNQEKLLYVNRIDSLTFIISKQNIALSQKESELQKAQLELQTMKKDNEAFKLQKFNTIVAIEGEYVYNEEEMFSLQVDKYSFRNFVVIDSVYEDDGDCLAPACHTMTFFKINNENLQKIDRAQLFKNGGFEIEKMINLKAKEELKEFQNVNSEEFDERYRKSVYQNHTFKGQLIDGYLNNQIELFRLDSRKNSLTFRTYVDYEQGDSFMRGDGMLFSEFTLEELLPYFAE